MMAAALVNGTTVLENAAKEPEIIDLAGLLVRMGAKIDGAGQSRVRIEGRSALHGASYTPMADRIEAGTLMLCSCSDGGRRAAARRGGGRASSRDGEAARVRRGGDG